MEKRILAVLLAAFAGSAAAQGYVTSGASGAPVTNGFGDCWRPGASGGSSACPTTAAGQTAPRMQVAQASTPADARTADTPRRTSSAADAAGRTATIQNPPPAPGYVGSGAGVVATNPYGLCWRAGSDWTPDKAAAPCDAVPRASLAVPPVAAAPAPAPEPQPLAVAEPTPAPTPAPTPLAAAPAPAPTVLEKITLNTDVLFEFNKADLRPEGQAKLDELARTAQGAKVEQVVIVGHADRIGSEQYNKELSERRAEAVKRYLSAKGVDEQRVRSEGAGESQPVTQCGKMGPENGSNKKLVECLQPDRRVDVELLGQREVAGKVETPSAGASTPSAGTSAPSTGASAPSTAAPAPSAPAATTPPTGAGSPGGK